jgi:hypothetical protein
MMARTVTIAGQFDMKRDSSQEDTFQTKLADQSISQYSHQVVTLSANTTNQDHPFPSGLTTAKFLHLQSSGSTMTYSVNTTSTHHRLEDGGFITMNGNFTSLCFSNNDTNTANTCTVILAG